ncbi:MAG: MBL fold metallo-hydrolase [Candidatus Odinarchaeota archaeon]
MLQSAQEPSKLILIDTGVDTRESKGILEKEIKAIDSSLSLSNIDWIIPTHAHVDHIGASKSLKDLSKAQIMMHRDEYDYFSSNMSIHWIDKLETYGVSKTFIELAKPHLKRYRDYIKEFEPDIRFNGQKGQIRDPLPEPLDFIQIPGHSPHHLAFLDYQQKVMISGDTILSEISPTLGFSKWEADSVKDYLHTLDLLKTSFKDWTAYPAHQRIVTDIGGRVDQLVKLYDERLSLVEKLLQEKEQYKMKELVQAIYPGTWEIPDQQFLAVMETVAYLKYFKQ